MNFEQGWDLFLQDQIRTASGVRLERLNNNLFGEKKMFGNVLWPVFQTFEGFSLEFAIKSISGVLIYLDVFYHPLRFVFECEGFVPHAENITRDRFAFERMRIRTLALYGYKFIPFSLDELDKRQEDCRRTVYELLGRYSGPGERAIRELTVYEREVIRYVLRLNRPFFINDVCHCLGLSDDSSRKVLRKLMEKQLIKPLGEGRQKIRLYTLDERAKEYML